jgi:hypothetical protein
MAFAASSLGQYELIQSEIRDSPAKTLVLPLQPLQLFKLIPHTSILLAPEVRRLLRDQRLPYCVNASLASCREQVYLLQLEGISFGLASLRCHTLPSAHKNTRWINSMGGITE